MKNSIKCSSVCKELEDRILVLDGGLGTMVQGYNLTEEDYRGELFADSDSLLMGCNDVLVLTAPDIIEKIHDAYFKAGADIVSTCSFNANAVSLADYGLEGEAYNMCRAAAKIARDLADKYTLKNPSKPRFVAGSMGPTNKTSSISPDVSNPAARGVTFDELVVSYTDQARGLLDGGADILLLETVFDTLNAKAALFAIDTLCEKRGVATPIMVSGTLADASGRTLSGQTVEAFYTSMSHANLLSIGFNCAYGAKQMEPYLERLSSISDFRISAHPNAGLPNVMGGYDETPQMMAADIESYLKKGIINIIGGCCGTTPVHIGVMTQLVKRYAPRPLPVREHISTLSGLEPLQIRPESNFINVGERANVAGSAKFARLIREEKFEEALSIARDQVENGAQIVDVCMDDGLIDGVQAMSHFLNLIMSEPEIAKVPIMIDSSSWDVLEAGLKCVQGKSIVNSISMKEGEEEFIRRAKLINRYGAAAVVMLFDERGQADSYERKIEVAKRAYDILVGIGFPAEDIVFDPNVLSVATGMEEHNSYGVAFIDACGWIKENLPYAKVSGGVSNLSFSFRGNNVIREAMHSVFLYHAIAKGMDMGIVNPGMLQIYSDIEPKLLKLTEDIVLNRSATAMDELMHYAEEIKSSGVVATGKVKSLAWRENSLKERVGYAMMKGVTDFIKDDILEAYQEVGTPLAVIDNFLMPAMGRVGELFGAGEMFLPQVVKSARVMKSAVDVLTPYIEAGGETTSSGGSKILIATVKGDVHDIGKNIVSVVMSCNGYQIEDLGVMIEGNKIVDRAEEWGADIIGLSGLITPSLDEMTKVVTELQRRGLSIPVIIGGATTSAIHTSVKIAPHYPNGVVLHSKDASDSIGLLSRLFSNERDAFIAEILNKQAALKAQFESTQKKRSYMLLSDAKDHAKVKSVSDVVVPNELGRVVFKEYPISDVIKYIDWNFFFPAWGLKGHYPEILESKECGVEAKKLFAEAQDMLSKIVEDKSITLSGVVGLYRAAKDGETIILTDEMGSEYRLPQLRNQQLGTNATMSLVDYVCSEGDYVGAFALTGGLGLSGVAEAYKANGDDYSAIMVKLLADRLTEAFAEVAHKMVREVMWGYEEGVERSVNDVLASKYQGVRVAFGYPACPDHSQKREVFDLLKVKDSVPMELTDNFMITPGESVCGLIFADKESKYFSVGHIDREQLEEYAASRGMDVESIARLIPQHLK